MSNEEFSFNDLIVAIEILHPDLMTFGLRADDENVIQWTRGVGGLYSGTGWKLSPPEIILSPEEVVILAAERGIKIGHSKG